MMLERYLESIKTKMPVRYRELVDLQTKIPELQISNGKLYSTYTNTRATGVEFEICDSGWVAAWIFVEVDGYRVYGNPIRFYIGFQNRAGFGLMTVDWRTALETIQVPEPVLKKIQNYINAHPRIDW